jgi:hypothetical protein
MTNKKLAEIVNQNAKKEDSNMNNNHSIYAAIEAVKTDAFREDMKEEFWKTPNLQLSWHQLWWDDDTTMDLKFFGQKNITEQALARIIIRFCDRGDSKARCRELEAAYRRGDYLVKKGHVDGHMVIIIQILIDR